MQLQEDLVKLPYLYVTTTGRKTGLPREIEIWFVEREGKFYIFAEHFFKANWVRNLQKNPRVQVRLGDLQFLALARILDETKDAELWQATQRMARRKYAWGDGLPVELTVIQPA
jgi:deazaflavin-dependent oxidoreductase (nitroreductase family)